jgi:hypothetical protein
MLIVIIPAIISPMVGDMATSAEEEIGIYENNLYLSQNIAQDLRNFRLALKIIPAPPKSGALFYLFIIGIPVILTIIAGIILRVLIYIPMSGFTGNLHNKWSIILFAIVISFYISLIVYYLLIQPYLDNKNIHIARNFAKAVGMNKEGFQTINANDIRGSDQILVNSQALSIKQTGYIGPTIDGGIFDPEIGILSALNAGVRMFTLQIDYIDIKKDGFEGPAIPTLLYRDDSGKLISTNGASINQVATHLSKAFSTEINHSTKPLIVYLHFQKLPYNRYDNSKKYVETLSSIAQALEPLTGNSLSFAPENYSRQSREKLILTTPLNYLNGKMILMSNIDTSLFRQIDAIGASPVEQKYDLDFLINIRVYKVDRTYNLGLTEVYPSTKIPAAIIIPFNNIISMSPSERDIFATENKHRFVIAMPSQEISNPSIDQIQIALTKACVNFIPLNLFGETIESIQRKKAIWNSNTIFLTKPAQYMTNPNESPHIPDTALKTLMAGT